MFLKYYLFILFCCCASCWLPMQGQSLFESGDIRAVEHLKPKSKPTTGTNLAPVFDRFHLPQRVNVPRWVAEAIPAQFKTHPEYGTVPPNAPCENCVELIHKRTVDQRFFASTEDRSLMVIQKAYTPLHIQDKHGQWRSLSVMLEPDPAKTGYYHAPYQSYPTYFDKNTGSCGLTLGNGTRFDYNRNMVAYLRSADGHELNLGKMNPKQTTVGSSGALTEEAWRNIDRQLLFAEGAIKTNFILKQRPTLTNGHLVFEETFVLPAGMVLVPDFKQGKAIDGGYWYGDLVLRDATGNEQMRLKKPLVYDADPTESDYQAYKDGRGSSPMYYGVEQRGEKTVLKIMVENRFLTNPNLTYPVTIDPWAERAITNQDAAGEVGVKYAPPATCTSPANACSSQVLNVNNIPGGYKVVDAYYFFNIQMRGDGPTPCSVREQRQLIPGLPLLASFEVACVLSNVYTQILGPCGSSSFFSFTDIKDHDVSGGGGFYIMDVNCIDAVGNCPQNRGSCVDYSLPFRMVTYGCNRDKLNCSKSDCSVAANNCHKLGPTPGMPFPPQPPRPSWGIILYVRDIEALPASVNDVSNFGCANEPVRLSAQSLHGVTPHTYSWTGPGITTPLTTQSITVTPSTTSTYTLRVSDPCGTVRTAFYQVRIFPTAGLSATITQPSCSNPNGGAIDLSVNQACGAGRQGCQSNDLVSRQFGNGTNLDNEISPYHNQFKDFRLRMIYSAQELIAQGIQPGKITQIEFFADSSAEYRATKPLWDYTIIMACTTASVDRFATADFNPLSSAVTVFGPKPFKVFAGRSVHVLDNPYVWDGKSSLVIEIYINSFVSSSGMVRTVENKGTSRVRSTPTTGRNTVIWRAINDTLGGSSFATGRLAVARPNIQFTTCRDFSYKWADGPTTEDRTGLAAGEYKVTITGFNNCARDTTIRINAASTISYRLNITQPTCTGPGAVELTNIVAGAGRTIAISSGSTFTPPGSTTLTGLNAGTYTIRVNDAGNCPKDTTITLSTANTAFTFNFIKTDATCTGATNGAITNIRVGGTARPPVQLSLTGPVNRPFQPEANFLNLSAGVYRIIARDASNCQDDTSNITISEGVTRFTPWNLAITQPPCEGTTGRIVINSVRGGTVPLQYAQGTGNFGTATTFDNLTAGNVILRVRDANGCTGDTTVILSVGRPNFRFRPIITQPPCAGARGQISLANMTGGLAPYTFAIGTGTFTNSPEFGNLTAGTYTLRVRDANNCTGDTTITLTDGSTTFTHWNFTINQPPCPGAAGSATINSIRGGTGPYQYARGAGNTNFTAGTTFNNLVPGPVVIRVRDVNGCIGDTTITIVNGTTRFFNWRYQVERPVCANIPDGKIILQSVQGGTPPYQFAVGNGAFQSGLEFANLPAGANGIRVRDANGCEGDTVISIDPTGYKFVISLRQSPSCPGAADAVVRVDTVSGGNQPYEFSLDGTSYAPLSDSLIKGLSSGIVSVYSKDGVGCVNIRTIRINDPDSVKATKQDSSNTCIGESKGVMRIRITGGRRPYRYSIDAGATYQFVLTGTDSSLITLENLPANTNFSVLVEDANRCTLIRPVTFRLRELLISLSALVRQPRCAGDLGFVRLIPSGGVEPYSFFNGTTLSPTDSFPGLAAGTYDRFRVVDAIGCALTFDPIVIQPAPKPVTFVTAPDTVRPTCPTASNGQLMVSASGGRGILNFALRSNRINRAFMPGQAVVSGNDTLYTFSFNELDSARYQILVRDRFGCEVMPISLFLPSRDTVSAGPDTLICKRGPGLMFAPLSGNYPSLRAGGRWIIPDSVKNRVEFLRNANDTEPDTLLFNTTADKDSVTMIFRSPNGCQDTKVIRVQRVYVDPKQTVICRSVGFFEPKKVSPAGGRFLNLTNPTLTDASTGRTTLVNHPGGTDQIVYLPADPVLAQACPDTFTVLVVHDPQPAINAEALNGTTWLVDKPVKTNNATRVPAGATELSYVWTCTRTDNPAGDGCPAGTLSGRNPDFNFTEPGIYRLCMKTITNPARCEAELCVDNIRVSAGYIFPSVITPNGDGINDVFKLDLPVNSIIETFAIFDRWGSRIYDSTDPNAAWNGTFNNNGDGVPTGVYYYHIKFVDTFKQTIERKGSITVLR